jgi:hypothetical protein
MKTQPSPEKSTPILVRPTPLRGAARRGSGPSARALHRLRPGPPTSSSAVPTTPSNASKPILIQPTPPLPAARKESEASAQAAQEGKSLLDESGEGTRASQPGFSARAAPQPPPTPLAPMPEKGTPGAGSRHEKSEPFTRVCTPSLAQPTPPAKADRIGRGPSARTSRGSRTATVSSTPPYSPPSRAATPRQCEARAGKPWTMPRESAPILARTTPPGEAARNGK